MGLVL